MRDRDLQLLRLLRTRGHSPGLERTAMLLGKAGNHGMVWLGIGLVLALLDPGNRDAWLVAAVLGPVAIAVNYALKLMVRRPRPVLEGLPPLGGAPSSLSFPSAHATASFAVAVAMTRVTPWGALAFALALPIAIGRPYLGMHYPSDVFAGAAVGIVLGFVAPLPG